VADRTIVTIRRYAMSNPKARAFTMLELLLVIVVMIVLTAIIVPNVRTRTAAGKIEYASRQLTGLLQLARSEAMATGKTYRLRFEVGGTKAMIEEELDPLKQPGVYEPVDAHWSTVDLGAGNVQCLVIEFDPWETLLREQEENVLDKEEKKEDEKLLPPILFYPDGTSDTATILLGNKDGWNYTLTINGLTGKILVEQGNKVNVAKKEESKSNV